MVAGVCRATRAAPDCTRVRRAVARLYQVGMAVCLTRQFLRLGPAGGVLIGHDELPTSSSAPPAMLGYTDVPLFHASFSSASCLRRLS
jgi:hypothetical protein